jgi:hypothetical protein
MLLLEPGGAAQAGGSLSGSVSCVCRTARRSCARFCCLRRTKFSRNALASFASRAARSMLFLAAIRGGSLILRCNKSAARLSRSQRPSADDFGGAGSAQKQRKSRSHTGKWPIHAAIIPIHQNVRDQFGLSWNNRICLGYQRNLHSQQRPKTMESGALFAATVGSDRGALNARRKPSLPRWGQADRAPSRPPDPPTLPASAPSCIGSHSSQDDQWTGRCRSSVVEHSLGKGEVVGSIPTGSTTLSAAFLADLGLGQCTRNNGTRREHAFPAGTRLAPMFGRRSPGRSFIYINRLRGAIVPSCPRLVPTRIGAFGSKIGPRVLPHFRPDRQGSGPRSNAVAFLSHENDQAVV